ncbi:LAQU0S04e05952g1_1 [Lachancea quebecensis]|uniref:LAQU0S04e05952g1_1 n=1 Tax=Lachancea quebecensis TaxID=1654605 RepID=A0A0P1KPV7_9SACH|nr:LAQU0S04e05952g1_1 [Lachancea quebecensis]
MQGIGPVAFTLRKHETEVTCLKVIDWEPYPILASGDAKGELYLWNLITRRSFANHKLETKAQVIYIEWKNNYLIVLSKDHTLRFLQLHSEAAVAAKDIIGHQAGLQSFSVVYEVPVNTLNFANVVVQQIKESQYRLWCCNTVDSESLDVYEFDVREQRSLRRLVNGINLYKVILKAGKFNASKSLDKTGIVMCFLEHNGIIYLGYECGFVLGLELVEYSGEKPNVLVSYVSSEHYPEPVLSLCYNERDRVILSSSTNDVVGVHTLQAHSANLSKPEPAFYSVEGGVATKRGLALDNKSIHLPTSKIGHLGCVDGALIAVDWNGRTLIFEKAETKFCFSKQRSNVLVDESSAGTFDQGKAPRCHIKATSMACIGKQTNCDLRDIRRGEKRRIESCANCSWCFTGYEDGSIIMQSFDT